MESLKKTHARLIEVHSAHGEELGKSKPFTVARALQAELLKDLCPQSILFIGPGHGDEARVILDAAGIDTENLRIIACDLNEHRMKRFKERFPHAETFCGAVLDPAFESFMKDAGAVDVVQMSFVLHDHTEREKPLLLETARKCLSAGGYLIAADPTMPNYPNYLPLIPNEGALADVENCLQSYFDIYMDEVRGWDIGEARKDELLASLKKGLDDALKHEDGREAFDTPEIYLRRFEEARFEDLVSKEGYNTIIVVRARVP